MRDMGVNSLDKSILGFLSQFSRWPPGPKLSPKNTFVFIHFHVDTLYGGFSGTFAETLHDFMQLITSSIKEKNLLLLIKGLNITSGVVPIYYSYHDIIYASLP